MSAQASQPVLAEIPASEILAFEQLPSSPADAVYAAGSVADGCGNPWSDIDIFVITDRSPTGPFAKQASTNETSQHYCRGRRIDFEFWRPEHVARLAHRLREFPLGSGKTIQGTGFLYIEECFMHRLRTAVPLAGMANVQAFQALFDFRRLSAYQSEDAARRADAFIEDICGMMEVRDGDAALFAARELVAAAADCFLHHLGSTDPVRKWRCRQLDRLGCNNPDYAWVVRQFWNLQFPNALRLRSNWEELRGYLEECLGFANRVIQQVQQ